MKKIKIGIDLSLRSAGISIVDLKNNLLKIYVHQPKAIKDESYEDLLINTMIRFKEIFKEISDEYEIDKINLEGLSFNSKSKVRDVIDANFWMLRCLIRELRFKLEIYSPANWRKINSIKDKNIKISKYKEDLGKDYWKLLALGKLNKETHDKIIYFCEDNNLKSKSEFDIADSYWIGCC